MISTKIIFGSDPLDLIENFPLISKGFVAKSIVWPNKLLNGLIPHGYHPPKHQGAKVGAIPIESIESYALRFV